MPDALTSAILLILLVVCLALLYFKFGKQESKVEIEDLARQKNAITPVASLGTYVTGIPYMDGLNKLESDKLLYFVTATSYVFLGFPRDSWRIVGEIPRDSVKMISVTKRDINMQKRIRKETALPFVFHYTKRKKENNESWHLTFNWINEYGDRRITVFEMKGPTVSVNAILNGLNRYILPQIYRKGHT